MSDPAFSMSNPNRVRALIGSFAMANPTQFHRPDGAGYDFVADVVLELDAREPAGRGPAPDRVRHLEDAWRAAGVRKAESSAAPHRRRSGLSPDVGDIVQRSLA